LRFFSGLRQAHRTGGGVGVGLAPLRVSAGGGEKINNFYAEQDKYDLSLQARSFTVRIPENAPISAFFF